MASKPRFGSARITFWVYVLRCIGKISFVCCDLVRTWIWKRSGLISYRAVDRLEHLLIEYAHFCVSHIFVCYCLLYGCVRSLSCDLRGQASVAAGQEIDWLLINRLFPQLIQMVSAALRSVATNLRAELFITIGLLAWSIDKMIILLGVRRVVIGG